MWRSHIILDLNIYFPDLIQFLWSFGLELTPGSFLGNVEMSRKRTTGLQECKYLSATTTRSLFLWWYDDLFNGLSGDEGDSRCELNSIWRNSILKTCRRFWYWHGADTALVFYFNTGMRRWATLKASTFWTRPLSTTCQWWLQQRAMNAWSRQVQLPCSSEQLSSCSLGNTLISSCWQYLQLLCRFLAAQKIRTLSSCPYTVSPQSL